jgi:hypothetical protein
MRAQAFVAVVAVVLMAGCAGPTTTSLTSHTASMPCPDWRVGLDRFIAHERFDENITRGIETDTLPASTKFLQDDQGYPLDRISLDFIGAAPDRPNIQQGIVATDSRLQLQFFRADTNEALIAYDLSLGQPGSAKNPGEHTLSYGPGATHNFTLEVHLATSTGAPAPGQVRIEYAFTPNLDGNPATPSKTTLDFTGRYLYRVCGNGISNPIPTG